MRFAPCRFNVPLTDNDGRPIDPQVILDLQGELCARFGGFTLHPTSQGRWQRRQTGRIYQEDVVFYEVAVPKKEVILLRELVCRLGRRLGQLAMYFDAPPPSVEVIDLSAASDAKPTTGGSNEPGPGQAARRRRKGDRPQS